jgi:hypothetical protein
LVGFCPHRPKKPKHKRRYSTALPKAGSPTV